MAKGDHRSKRGKITRGSHGRRRPNTQRQKNRLKERGF
ncbi:30S ribosomal protein THX [Modicisalibacter xianhensis]|uniref:Ribosomal small subunit protein bTHX n=1 Tax=Modicisalibacter xianhensis TaxID=442341 RepID=A0A4R8FZZ9_9GAMM|nr:30S ribosomal protein THX [Halomonas xianhensis]TDX32777.1 ribosomal small subunit protein bTHX [Halomonas xianhensis]